MCCPHNLGRSKGGRSQITDVLEYGEAIGGRKGLVIMRGPGYDPVSLTGDDKISVSHIITKSGFVQYDLNAGFQ